MPFVLDFFIPYAYPIVFLWVMSEQMGVPIPAVPLLLTAGTLTATHKLSLPLVLLSTLCGSLVSDTLWYFMGRRYGGAVVKLVCKLALETATCVRRTEDYFTKHGPSSLLVAKFLPGLGSVAAPIAGQTGMPFRVFVAYDAAGVMIWALAATLTGRFFGDVLKRNPGALAWVGHSAGGLFLLLVLGFLAWRVWKQQAFLKEIRMARLEPTELKRMLDSGKNVFIVDLRHPLDYLPDPRTLPGAVRLTPDKLVANSDAIPRDQDIVLFCTCPSEATAAKMALTMRKLGIHRVRPLRGGYDGWKDLGYPLVDMEPEPLDVV
jgi:membrane protein DedA with SNARE-associated domain/rhodanese-related sulfurtransferase